MDLVGHGLDLEPATLRAAYRQGLFPMPGPEAGRDDGLYWFCPDPRGILPLAKLRVSRSLRKSCHRFTVTVDQDFDAVMRGCAETREDGNWINEAFMAAYARMHDLGMAHSVEVWNEDARLVGGVYGVSLGGLFAGESMFHRATDASKVALVALVAMLKESDRGQRLLDVQWSSRHLASLGVEEVARDHYLSLLSEAVEDVEPNWLLPEAWRP